MPSEDVFEVAGFKFFGNFDSGNILQVDLVAQSNNNSGSVHSVFVEQRADPRRKTLDNRRSPNVHGQAIRILPKSKETDTHSFRSCDEPHYIFNVKTKPDCYGSPYENPNRTWFFFGVSPSEPNKLVRINLVDINKQSKMYSQGMAPVFKCVPSRLQQWQRIKDRPTFQNDDGVFTLTFHFNTSDNAELVHYFAFTYPFTYEQLQGRLANWDGKFLTQPNPIAKPHDIYYKRECVTLSLEKRRIDLLTISDYSNITNEMEARLKHLFVDKDVSRPFKFFDKKVIFISARVHPGETPSSFVFNGFEKFILTANDPHAIALRKKYVFKLIPFLNPDGVAKGHYRTDTRGLNLNRFYLRPSHVLHPSVYAARSIIRYHHFKYEEREENYLPDDGAILNNLTNEQENRQKSTEPICQNCGEMVKTQRENDVFETQSRSECDNDLNESVDFCQRCIQTLNVNDDLKGDVIAGNVTCDGQGKCDDDEIQNIKIDDGANLDENANDSGLFLYLDLHGHASKKGIFMYGNHFDDLEKNVESMLLPKLMSINNYNFHFMSCNFTERNMYLKDRRDGRSREGSGRVAVMKLTGCVRSYTLECNYNMGKMTNDLPPLVQNPSRAWHLNYLPKYSPSVYEEVGRALGPSILDMTGDNPNSRLPQSEFRSLSSLKEWLRYHICDRYPCFAQSKRQIPAKLKSMRTRPRLHRTTSRILTPTRPVIVRRRSLSNLTIQKPAFTNTATCSKLLNKSVAKPIVKSAANAKPASKLVNLSSLSRFDKLNKPSTKTTSKASSSKPSTSTNVMRNIHSNRASQLRSKFTSTVISKFSAAGELTRQNEKILPVLTVKVPNARFYNRIELSGSSSAINSEDDGKGNLNGEHFRKADTKKSKIPVKKYSTVKVLADKKIDYRTVFATKKLSYTQLNGNLSTKLFHEGDPKKSHGENSQEILNSGLSESANNENGNNSENIELENKNDSLKLPESVKIAKIKKKKIVKHVRSARNSSKNSMILKSNTKKLKRPISLKLSSKNAANVTLKNIRVQLLKNVKIKKITLKNSKIKKINTMKLKKMPKKILSKDPSNSSSSEIKDGGETSGLCSSANLSGPSGLSSIHNLQSISKKFPNNPQESLQEIKPTPIALKLNKIKRKRVKLKKKLKKIKRISAKISNESKLKRIRRRTSDGRLMSQLQRIPNGASSSAIVTLAPKLQAIKRSLRCKLATNSRAS